MQDRIKLLSVIPREYLELMELQVFKAITVMNRAGSPSRHVRGLVSEAGYRRKVLSIVMDM